MKDRLLSLARTQLWLAAAGVAFALPLTGCSGAKTPSDATSGAAVQGGGGPSSASGGSATAGRRRMAAVLMGLGLSAEQKSQIRDIMRQTRKENANADPETRRANYKAAFAKIDALLSPDQRTKLHAKLDRGRTPRDQAAPSQS